MLYKRTESKQTRRSIARAKMRRQERQFKESRLYDIDLDLGRLDDVFSRITYRRVWRPIWTDLSW